MFTRPGNPVRHRRGTLSKAVQGHPGHAQFAHHPTLTINPARTFAMQGQAVRYPPIAELAQPMLRLAGMRINPKTNGLHNTVFNSSLTLRKDPEGTEIKVELPPNPKLSLGRWSPDAKHFAFTNTTERGIELWLGDTSGKARRIEGVRVNEVMGGGLGGGRGGRGGGGPSDVQWMPDGKSLLVEMVKPNRGAAPAEPVVPTGPHVQESLGGASPVGRRTRTCCRIRTTRICSSIYATSPTRDGGCRHRQGDADRQGRHHRIRAHLARWQAHAGDHHPPAVLLPARRAIVPQGDRDLGPHREGGAQGREPAAGGSRADQRRADRAAHHQWRPTEPATLMWVEALDKGDLKNKVPYRDRLVALKAPFTGEPREVFKTEQRFSGMQFFEKGGRALIEDSERQTRRVRTFQIEVDDPGADAQAGLEPQRAGPLQGCRHADAEAAALGRQRHSAGRRQHFPDGPGREPQGRPSVPRSLQHRHAARRSASSSATTIITRWWKRCWTTTATKFLTRRESPTEPPNYYVRTAGRQDDGDDELPRSAADLPQDQEAAGDLQARRRRAAFLHALSAAGLQARHAAADADLGLSARVQRCRYRGAGLAAPPSASPRSRGYSQLFHVLDGFAVLDNAAMPVVGDPDTVNNTYIEQIVADAKAAIDKAAEMGVTDPDARRRGRPQLWRLHDGQPAGALRSVQGGDRRERRAQSHADAVRFPERAADDLAGAGCVHEDVAVHVRR